MSSAHNVCQATFMEGDYSVGFDILDPYDPTTKLLGSLARSQYPFTLYPTNTTAVTPTTMSPSAFSSTSVKATTTLASHHPWSDMVFADMCPMDLSPGISSSLSTTSSPSSTHSSSTSCTLSFSSSSPLSPTFQTSSVLDASYSSSSTRTSPFDPCTHEHFVCDIPTAKKKNNSEYLFPFDGDFRPRHDSLLDMSMTLDDLDHAFDEQLGDHEHETDHESDQDMDIDSNGSLNDNDTSSKSSPFSRDSSTISDVTGPKPSSSLGSPEPKATSSNSDEKAPSTKTKSKSKTKAKSTKTKSSSTTSATLGRPTKASRKQSGAEQLSSEAKRQRFLERNRLAAAKCREKKRLQTLKTITDADEITAKNQALHESLDELQEEVRKLKNQILCHRDCGCDVIQKFVKTSLVPSLSSSSLSSSSRKMSLDWNPSFSPPYFQDG